MTDDTYSVGELGAEPDEFFFEASKLTLKREDGLVFEWYGGEYIDVKVEGAEYAHECINTSRPDGSFPDFTEENMLAEIAEWEE